MTGNFTSLSLMSSSPLNSVFVQSPAQLSPNFPQSLRIVLVTSDSDVAFARSPRAVARVPSIKLRFSFKFWRKRV